MPDPEVLLHERRGPVAIFTINRPEKRNALSVQVRVALLEAIDAVARDRDVRAVILTGAGAKAFVAGADIAEFAGRTPVDQYRVMRAPSVLEAIERSPKPFLAAIN